MSQFEYSVPLADAKPHQMDAVGKAYRAGQQAEQERILKLLGGISKHGYVQDALFAIQKKIRETGNN